MTTPAEKRDIRRFRMISVAPTIVEPRSRRLVFDPATFQGVRPGAPLLADHVNASGRVAGRVLTAWVDRNAGAVLGTVEIYPDNIEAAAHVRRLLNAGHRGASIRHDGVVEPNPDRIGPNMVRDWGIAHLAVVGEGADPTAGQLSATDGTVYFDLEILAQEGDEMTQPNFDLATVLPQLSAAIAQGVREGNQATDTGGPAPADQMTQMLQIALSQPELYARGAVAELALDAAQGLIASPADFRAKLESIHINPRPIAAGLSDAEVSDYNLGAIMQGVLSGDFSNASKELSRSTEIKRKSEIVGRLSAGTVAIPFNELVSHSGDSGTGAAGTAVREVQGEFYDVGTPDSTDILPLMTRLPGGPGKMLVNAVTVPQPGHIAEPTGDTGYAKTGDASAVGNELAPSILVDYLNATRLLNTIEPDYWDAVLSIVSRRFDEQQNKSIVVGDTSDSPLENGIYGLANIGSTANLSAAITTAIVEAALSASVHYAGPDANRVIVTTETNVATMRTLAQPAAVNALMAQTTNQNGSDMVRDARVFSTNFFPAAKTRRGIAGPMSNVLLKEWDDSLYVSMRYEAGIAWLLVEKFWTIWVRHPALFYRFREN